MPEPIVRGVKRWLPLVLSSMAAIVSSGPSVAWAERVYGITLPPDARRIDEDRYRATQNYNRTIRYFSRLFGRSRGLIWQPIRGSAEVRGVHIINHRPGRQWDALNIYETDDKVYIYVVTPKTLGEKKR